jgi:hypothetical protein
MEKTNNTKYNGWTNYQTWNVALWIGNDEGLYKFARACRDYDQFASQLRELGVTETPDKVAYNDSGLDTEELDNMIKELRGEEE